MSKVRETAREIVAKAFEKLADNAESSIAWTENNFLPGPNTAASIARDKEDVKRFLEEASDWRAGYCDNFAKAELDSLETVTDEMVRAAAEILDPDLFSNDHNNLPEIFITSQRQNALALAKSMIEAALTAKTRENDD